jgi:tetratricopeptide (TPR) repeat protein
MPGLPRLSACPNCKFSVFDLKGTGLSSVGIAKCRDCGQIMCAYCCKKNSFWSGYICQNCGSKIKDNIGRIKNRSDIPTFLEDMEECTERSGDDPNRVLEARGVELAKQSQYAEARRIFEKVLPTKAIPLHRAEVLQKIGFTYEREGNKEEAIRIYQKILEVPGLYDTTDGVLLHGRITGHVNRLQGRSSLRSMPVGGYAVFASTALGALVGSEMYHPNLTGMVLGVLVGFFLSLPIAQVFLSGATSMYRFTLDEERNREVYEQYVIPTAKVLLFITGAVSIIALIMRW